MLSSLGKSLKPLCGSVHCRLPTNTSITSRCLSRQQRQRGAISFTLNNNRQETYACCCICNRFSCDSFVRPLQCQAVLAYAFSSGHPTATYTATQFIRQEPYVYSVRGKQLANYVSSVRSVAAAVYSRAFRTHSISAPPTGVTLLVDPWLEGDLVFANQTWLYRGSKGALNDVKLDLDAIGSQADVILLSQVRGAAKSQP